jgi:bifunctional DNA-binding transcriptional regulator/antitoxin component of YhaV-PrlF toxin-antitoxin module
MHLSRVTVKGQTTIPLQIRKFLGISPHDLVSFNISGGKVFLNTEKKTVLDFKAAFKTEKTPVDYETVREKVKLKVAEKISGLSK